MSQFLLITGGAGRIATALRPLLRGSYRLRLTDIQELPAPVVDGEDFVRVNASDLPAMERACQGVDAVLHLAANPSTNATWDELLEPNYSATYAVFEAARRAGVRKVVFASSNHVMGFANLEGAWPIGVDDAIRPDTLYGVSKAFGEALARYFSEAFDMSMICMRIGWFTPNDPTARGLQPLWISARDLAQVVDLAVKSPRKFGIYNASSNNSMREWDLQKTRDELGFEPVDDVSTLGITAQGEDRSAYADPKAGVLRAQQHA